MTVLVTGGGGFLGGSIVRLLLERGETVRSFARGDYPELAGLGVDCRRGDLADPAAVDRAVAGVDAVFHVAARAGVWGSRAAFRAANVGGTRHVIEACRRHGTGKLIYTSTPSVIHAGGDVSGADESAPYPERFSAPYPESKAEAERMVLASSGASLATVALRPHLIWGPGDNQLVPSIVERARAGRAWLIGPGDNLIDTTYIDNAASAHVAAFDRLEPDAPCAGRAYFIAQGEPRPIRVIINELLGAAGVAPLTRSLPYRFARMLGWVGEQAWRVLPGEPPLTRFLVEQLATEHWYDLTAARRDLGYRPAVAFAEGLERLAAWYGSRP